MKLPLIQGIFIFIILITSISYPQAQELNFELVSAKSGISLGKINNIVQDPYGFIWFSDQTNRCLLRYDGSQMIKYPYDPRKENSLGGYYPECLAVDSSGIIWIGFYGQGLDRFDLSTHTFTHYQHDPDDPESLIDDVVNFVLVDHLGMVWVGTNKGLDQLDPETGKFTHFNHKENDPTSISHDLVRIIYEDRQGTLWVGTGLPWILDNKGGLNRYERETKNFTRYKNIPDNPNSLLDNKVRAILEDSKGNFWVGTSGNGLHIMDRETGLFTRYSYDPRFPDKLSAPAPESEYAHITFIREDLSGHIWIGTYENGINSYDPQTKIITHYGTNGKQPGDFIENSSWWAHISTDGIIWLTTQQSRLYKIDPYINTFPEVAYEARIVTVIEHNDAELWIGTFQNGLIREHLKTGFRKRYTHNLNDPNSLSNNSINKLYLDQQDKLWVGTSNGLNLFDPETDSFTTYEHNPNEETSLSNASVLEIYEDHNSNLWIGTSNGLNRMDRKTGKFTRYDHDAADPTSLSDPVIQNIIEDHDLNLWIGTLNGLNKMDRKTGKFERFLTGANIIDMYLDKKGFLWLGTLGGLFRSDENRSSFNSFVSTGSGTFVGEIVRSVTGDAEDNLWLGTSAGIIKLSKDREVRTVYGKENGVNPDEYYFLSAAYTGKDGTLYFAGSEHGYYAFNPDEFKKAPGKMKLFFTNLWVNNQLVYPEEEGPIQKSMLQTEKIRLKYNENVFGLSFTAVDFRNTIEKRIFYKMEPYDQDWVETLAGQKIIYNRVPPGNYTLNIKAPLSNSSDWEEKSIEIFIAKPWWKTWWAYSTYVLLLVLMGWRIHLFQKARTIRIEREKTQQRELEHAREIEKAYNELGVAHENLKSTQAQLIQSEKMASLGELTAGIAHEIQNPLNFVNNFSELNSELIEELKEEIEKGDLEEAKAIARDVKANEEKIHHHGQRASGIVKGMLEHSRMSKGEKTPTAINVLCDEYLRLAYHASLAGRQGFRANDKDFNVVFQTDFDPNLSKINVVPQDIGRVLLNLINNAFYACAERLALSQAEGSLSTVNERKQKVKSDYIPAVTVSTKKENEQVVIKIADNGTGIPKDNVDKIFQPFFTTKPTGQGTGLGLSLAYDIVKAHGGELRVDSEDGKGTEFIIHLPIDP